MLSLILILFINYSFANIPNIGCAVRIVNEQNTTKYYCGIRSIYGESILCKDIISDNGFCYNECKGKECKLGCSNLNWIFNIIIPLNSILIPERFDCREFYDIVENSNSRIITQDKIISSIIRTSVNRIGLQHLKEKKNFIFKESISADSLKYAIESKIADDSIYNGVMNECLLLDDRIEILFCESMIKFIGPHITDTILENLSQIVKEAFKIQ